MVQSQLFGAFLLHGLILRDFKAINVHSGFTCSENTLLRIFSKSELPMTTIHLLFSQRPSRLITMDQPTHFRLPLLQAHMLNKHHMAEVQTSSSGEFTWQIKDANHFNFAFKKS